MAPPNVLGFLPAHRVGRGLSEFSQTMITRNGVDPVHCDISRDIGTRVTGDSTEECRALAALLIFPRSGPGHQEVRA